MKSCEHIKTTCNWTIRRHRSELGAPQGFLLFLFGRTTLRQVIGCIVILAILNGIRRTTADGESQMPLPDTSTVITLLAE